MGANTPTFQDLARVFGSGQAQVQAAQSGGYGNGSQLLNLLAPTMAAFFPNGPLPRALQAFNQTRNLMDYGKSMQERYNAERQYQQQMEQRKMADNAHTARQLGFEGHSGAGDVPSAAQAQFRGTYNQQGAYDDMLRGKPLRVAPGGVVDQQTMRDYMDRVAQVADTQDTLDAMPGYMGQAVPGTQPQPGESEMLDYSYRDPNALQAGARQNDLFEQNPYGVATPDVSQLLTGRKNEQTDRLGNRKATETERHNQFSEADIARYRQAMAAAAGSNAQANMIRANKYQPGGGGGGGSQLERALGAGIISQDEYRNTLLRANQGKPPSAQVLKILDQYEDAYNDASASPGGWWGIGAKDAKPAKQAQSKAMYNAIAGQYGLPRMGAAPFGGRAQGKLNQAGQGLYGLKY